MKEEETHSWDRVSLPAPPHPPRFAKATVGLAGDMATAPIGDPGVHDDVGTHGCPGLEPTGGDQLF